MNYGLPYCGSKSRIAEWIMEFIPKSECFVDVFAGGCAVTHAAMEYRRANRYIINDVNWMPTQLFLDAVNGKYRNESRWISRDDYFSQRDSDPYIAYCWSFGNDYTKSYLYSIEIEPYKKACHCAIVFDDWSLLDELCPEIASFCMKRTQLCKNRHDRRLIFGQAAILQLKRLTQNNAKHPIITNNPLYNSCHKKTFQNSIRHVQSLERLERLQSLERLERLQSLERLKVDYRKLQIPKDAFVYCDPPYKDSGCDYNVEFNHDEFYNWCVKVSKTNQILISEYNIDDPRFECVGEKEKLVSLASTKSMLKTERLYTVKK